MSAPERNPISMAHLQIVLINWNSRDDTLACIESLLAAGAEPHQVVLVDNGSQDGSVQALQQRFGGALHLVANPENRGYVLASNQGIQFALDQGAAWILLMNNDTLVAADFFAPLLQAIATQPQYAILAPLIYYHSQPQRIWYVGDRLVPGTLLTWSRYKNRTAGQLPAILPVDFISGCAMLVRRDVYEQVGLFDPALEMYGEEVDFCWRARSAGYALAAVTGAHMWHKVSASANRVKPHTRYLRVRNQARFYNRYGRRQRPFLFSFSLLKGLLMALNDLRARQPELIRPLARGLWDGWRTS